MFPLSGSYQANALSSTFDGVEQLLFNWSSRATMSSRFERLKGKFRSSSPATSSAVSSTTSSSAVNVVTDLWDQAYLDLKNDSKTKRLIEEYEKIILGDAKKGGISASDLQAYYDAELSSKREQMSRVLSKLDQRRRSTLLNNLTESSIVSFGRKIL
jgi:ElaB/YqjD/DUF883 family membrane-anchored ribosome-binding protein